MPYISVNHSLKIDFSAHSFSEPFTENRILLLRFQWIHSLKIDSSAQSFRELFTENSFYAEQWAVVPHFQLMELSNDLLLLNPRHTYQRWWLTLTTDTVGRQCQSTILTADIDGSQSCGLQHLKYITSVKWRHIRFCTNVVIIWVTVRKTVHPVLSVSSACMYMRNYVPLCSVPIPTAR